MSLIISIETSTNICSIALHNMGKLLYIKSLISINSHFEKIFLTINYILKITSYKKKKISAIAVSKGPGSYTGLKIGLSCAKSFCYILKIPLIMVNTLKAMALSINKYNIKNFLLCPVIDAKKTYIYYILLDRNLNKLEKTNKKIIYENSFDDWLKKNKIIFFGNGFKKYINILSKNKNIYFINNIFPSANNIGVLAYKKFKENKFKKLSNSEPFYL